MSTLETFNRQLEYFTDTPPFANHIHDDPENALKDKQELYENIWLYFQRHKNKFQKCVYKGRIIRVMDCQKPKVVFDGYLTHWSACIRSFIAMAKGFEENKRYTWVVAEVSDGFYINNYEHSNIFCRDEFEVIYPMNKEVVTDLFYGTFEEFERHCFRQNR